MTTTVRTGTRRSAARARTEKHAQRTPLPGDAPSTSDNFDTLGLPELRQLARAQGWSTLESVTKPQIVTALREHPGGAPDGAQPLGQAKSAKSKGKEKSNVDTREDAGTALARRIAAARENGYSRKDIADASDLTQSVIWRIQAKGVVKTLEVDKITGALDRIESGQLEPTRRGRPRGGTASVGGSRVALQSKLDSVHQLLSDVPMNSNKVTEYRAAITAALDVIDDNV